MHNLFIPQRLVYEFDQPGELCRNGERRADKPDEKSAADKDGVVKRAERLIFRQQVNRDFSQTIGVLKQKGLIINRSLSEEQIKETDLGRDLMDVLRVSCETEQAGHGKGYGECRLDYQNGYSLIFPVESESLKQQGYADQVISLGEYNPNTLNYADVDQSELEAPRWDQEKWEAENKVAQQKYKELQERIKIDNDKRADELLAMVNIDPAEFIASCGGDSIGMKPEQVNSTVSNLIRYNTENGRTTYPEDVTECLGKIRDVFQEFGPIVLEAKNKGVGPMAYVMDTLDPISARKFVRGSFFVEIGGIREPSEEEIDSVIKKHESMLLNRSDF